MAELNITVKIRKTIWYYIASFCVKKAVSFKFLGIKTICRMSIGGKGKVDKVKFDFGSMKFD